MQVVIGERVVHEGDQRRALLGRGRYLSLTGYKFEGIGGNRDVLRHQKRRDTEDGQITEAHQGNLSIKIA